MCGFVGAVGGEGIAREVHVGLQALQHRGQDSSGIGTMVADGTRFHVRRGLGTTAQALGGADLDALLGPIAIGHVRYPTIGRGVLEDAQPFFYRQPGIVMAHNGNITNYDALRDGLRERSIHLLSHCDVEPVLCELADALMAARPARHTVEDVVRAATTVQRRVRGSYSLAAALMLDGKPTLMLLRDPSGIRPLVYGTRADGTAIAASESVALDVLGVRRFEEPAPGELVLLRAGEPPLRRGLVAERQAPCVFEFIYFARPDSVMEGRSVYDVRLGLGRALADRIREKGLVADVVIPVPDTARPAATTLSEGLGVPMREGFIKNRYTGRTFIMPDQLTRQGALRLKLNPLPGEIRGRRVLLVDDSIVRGTTLRRVIELVREVGAREIHLGIHSPPVRHPCYYGIDMSTEEELFARRFSEDLGALEGEAARALGVDSLTFVPNAGLAAVFGGPKCAACFDGAYPEPLPDHDRASIVGDRRGAR